MLNREKKQPSGHSQTKRTGQFSPVRLLILVAMTVALFTVYRFLMNGPYFFYVMLAYMAVFTVLTVTYIIYNRGFSRRGVTPEMLPDEWSEEEKTAFIEDGRLRLAKSRWMLMTAFALGVTFALDAMELFVLPFFKNLF